jgi:hypothetical protein
MINQERSQKCLGDNEKPATVETVTGCDSARVLLNPKQCTTSTSAVSDIQKLGQLQGLGRHRGQDASPTRSRAETGGTWGYVNGFVDDPWKSNSLFFLLLR